MLDNMNAFHARLFRQTVDMLIAKELISKGSDAAAKFNMTLQQYKNIRAERTPMNKIQWESFQRNVRQLDPDYTFHWLQNQLFPE